MKGKITHYILKFGLLLAMLEVSLPKKYIWFEDTESDETIQRLHMIKERDHAER